MKLAARLSALYAVLLGVTVLIVILASSIALVFELRRFSGDVMIAKHEEARILGRSISPRRHDARAGGAGNRQRRSAASVCASRSSI